MKKVTRRSRKFTTKDIARFFLATFNQYLIFSVYTFLIILINHFVHGGWFFDDLYGIRYSIFYFIIAAPGINSILYLTFEELGSPWLRLTMWLNSTISVIFICVAIFNN